MYTVLTETVGRVMKLFLGLEHVDILDIFHPENVV